MAGNVDVMRPSGSSMPSADRRRAPDCDEDCAGMSHGNGSASAHESSSENHLDSSAESRTHQPCRRSRKRRAGDDRGAEWTRDSTSDVVLEMPAPGDGLDARTRALVDALVEIAFRALAGGGRVSDREGR